MEYFEEILQTKIIDIACLLAAKPKNAKEGAEYHFNPLDEVKWELQKFEIDYKQVKEFRGSEAQERAIEGLKSLDNLYFKVEVLNKSIFDNLTKSGQNKLADYLRTQSKHNE